MTAGKSLKVISLRDNPLACDCKLQYFAEWLGNATQLASKVNIPELTCFSNTPSKATIQFQDLMAFCKTPPFLEGAQLSQLSVDSLTCSENHLESDNDQIMSQINTMFSDFNDNFTMINSSSTVS